MQTNLRNAAFQFREALDGEVARAVGTLQFGAATVRDGSSDRYADRFDAWASTAAHPQVVGNVFLLNEEGSAIRVRRWNNATRTLEDSTWPTALEPWREAIEADRRSFAQGPGFGRPPLVVDDESVAVIPLRQQPGPNGGPNVPVWGFTVVELNIPLIQTQVLPELAERYFSIASESGYRVAVLSASDPSRVIYRSDEDAPTDTSQADAVEPLMGVAGRLIFNRGPGGRNGDARRSIISVFRAPGNRAPVGLGQWLLLAQHELGSLDSAVGASRRRNLGISFGILLLLSGTVLMLTISTRRAERLARQQMEFVAGVSHELRTPIAVIRSASENLSQGVVASPERVKRYGDTIGTEARRLGDMVERVLQYAGIEAGRVISTTVPLDPRSCIESALQATSSLITASGITVERSLSANLPLILGDASALTSAVQNLITNAVKYGGKDRWLGVSATESRGARGTEVRISVEDHGAGIPNADLPHLFEPFYRGARATTAQIQGNGLGLSIVKRIVEAHGGRVTVSTRPGAGTTFTIHLPAAPASAVADSSMVETAGAAVHS
jgi:signal transduction histidine kinase